MAKIATAPLTTLGAAAAAVVADIKPPKPAPFEPGIYFGLDEDAYHADAALGSTDIRRLARDPRAFWWESRFNPYSEEDDEKKDSDAKIVGHAIHSAVLEGREALEARFAPTFHKGNVKEGKEERKTIEAQGKTPIKFSKWQRALLASAIIRNDENVGDAFRNTIGTEVSVFYVCKRSGMRKKARFDAIKPKSIVDLKSITNRDDVNFEDLCHRHIGAYGYYTQGACYMDAWAEIPALIASGSVFNAPSAEAVGRLAKAATSALTAFTFVFLQKEGAPLVYGTHMSPGNPLFDQGRVDIERAEENWTRCIKKFGSVDVPWIESRPLAELDISDIPAWAFRRN